MPVELICIKTFCISNRTCNIQRVPDVNYSVVQKTVILLVQISKA